MKLVHGSLFSGFDAPSVAASWMGWENAFHCEINDFCNEILKYWFPNSEHYEDITKTDFSQWRGRIDILTGGVPCQPFSVAGQRKGADDNRYLWPHMLRAIREIRPTWVIGENVAGILTMVQPGEETEMGSQTSIFGEDNRKRVLLRQEYVVETICKDLEREGYSVQPMLIPACAVGAPHRRDRVWFVAHCSDARIEKVQQERTDGVLSNGITPNTNGNGYLPPKTCQGIERRWRRDFSQQKEWGDTPERTNGLYGLSRNVTYSNGEKLQKRIETGRRADEEENRARMDNGIERFGSLRYAPYSDNERLQVFNISQWNDTKRRKIEERCSKQHSCDVRGALSAKGWKNFPTQSPVCRGNDGLPFNVDDLTIPFTKWRQESVKGYGNAIVPQVILEIFKAIEEVEQLE